MSILFYVGLGAVELVDPPSGSVISNIEGAINATTLTCNVLSQSGIRTNTNWFVQNFNALSGLQGIGVNFFPELFLIGGEVRPDDPTRTFLNKLTILNCTYNLDRVTVFCGTGTNRRQAHFTLRVYSKFFGLNH